MIGFPQVQMPAAKAVRYRPFPRAVSKISESGVLLSYAVVEESLICHLRMGFATPVWEENSGHEGIMALTLACLSRLAEDRDSPPVNVVPGYWGPSLEVTTHSTDLTAAVSALIKVVGDENIARLDGANVADAILELTNGNSIEKAGRRAMQESLWDVDRREAKPSNGPGTRLGDVSLTTIQAVATKLLTPSLAVLSISGPAGYESAFFEKAGPVFRNTYTPGPGRSPLPGAAEFREPRRTLLRLPGSSEQRVLLGLSIRPNGDQAELLVLEHLMSAGASSLHQLLRHDLGLTYGVSARLIDVGSETAWVLAATTTNDRLTRLIQEVRQYLADLPTVLRSPGLVERAKVGVIADMTVRNFHAKHVANHISDSFQRNQEAALLDQLASGVEHIVTEDLIRAAVTHFRADLLHEVVLGDTSAWE